MDDVGTDCRTLQRFTSQPLLILHRDRKRPVYGRKTTQEVPAVAMTPNHFLFVIFIKWTIYQTKQNRTKHVSRKLGELRLK